MSAEQKRLVKQAIRLLGQGDVDKAIILLQKVLTS